MRVPRRERSRESLGTDSLKEDKTNDTRCWQPHSNHLRQQQGKSSNLAQWVSALAVQQNHHLEKIYIHGQAQPKLLSKICSEKMYISVFFKELQVFSPIKLAKIPEFEYSLEKQAFL